MAMEFARCGQYASGLMRSPALLRCVSDLHGSPWFGRKPRMLRGHHSFEDWKRTPKARLRRACSACFEDNSEEQYMKNLQELALQCHMADEGLELKSTEPMNSGIGESECHGLRGIEQRKLGLGASDVCNSKGDSCFSWPAELGSKANEVGLPLSLRILKKKQCSGKQKISANLAEAGQAASCSIKKAFSSMVFMIRELQTYTLQIRQILFYEDLHELLGIVRRETQASFVWLFQQVFSCTPALMVSVMILLANFTVHSMGNNVAVAAIPPFGSPASAISIVEDAPKAPNQGTRALSAFVEENPSFVKLPNQTPPPLVNSDIQNSLSLCDGLGGGGGKNLAIAGGADGDSHREGKSQNQAMLSKDNSVKASVSSLPHPVPAKGEDMSDTSVNEVAETEDKKGGSADQIGRDIQLWQSFLKEFESSSKGEAQHTANLDQETMKRLVAPVSARVEPDNYTCFDRTDLLYQHAISIDPDNALLLSNYAQFLHLVRHDHDRAEEYFNRAMKSDSVDGEAIVSFATFLWLAKGDISAAEKAYLDAIAADPRNPFHAGSYAHFLWNTGGEESSCSANQTI